MRWAVEVLSETDSTNRQLLARARGGTPEGAVLVADQQTAGRGRLDRSWDALPGSSLLVSVLLRPGSVPSRAHLFTIAAGLAAADACADVADCRPALKWPNDLIVDDRQLAGILTDSIVRDGRLDAL